MQVSNKYLKNSQRCGYIAVLRYSPRIIKQIWFTDHNGTGTRANISDICKVKQRKRALLVIVPEKVLQLPFVTNIRDNKSRQRPSNLNSQDVLVRKVFQFNIGAKGADGGRARPLRSLDFLHHHSYRNHVLLEG